MSAAADPSTPTRLERMPLLIFAGWWAVTLGWWGLAFASVTPASPEWLARTQSVCFGNLSNGLPDSYGWTRLILAPLGLLIPLLVVHGAELMRSARRGWAHPAGRVALAGLLAVSLAEGAWVGGRIRGGLAVAAASLTLPYTPGGLPEGYPRLERPAPDFRGVDQHGAALGLADLRGQVVYLTFAFAHCSATCPLTVRSLLQAAQRSRAFGARAVVITLDPWRDTPSALPALAARWALGEGDAVLSGTVPQVLATLARYEVGEQRDANTGDIAHPALVYVIDRAGRIAYLLNNPPPDWIVAAWQRAAQPAGS